MQTWRAERWRAAVRRAGRNRARYGRNNNPVRKQQHIEAAGSFPAALPCKKDIDVTTGWNDLSKDEQTALKRLNRGPYPELETALGQRLIALGLAEDRPRGIGINRAGRELVIGTLLAARDAQPSED